MKKGCCSRREFVSMTGKSAAILAILSPGVGSKVLGMGKSAPSSKAPVTLDLTNSDFNALTKVGGAIKVPDTIEGGKPIIVVRTSETAVTALSSKCTHWGCELPLPGDEGIICPCHGAKYSSEGKALKGPAKKNLKTFPAVLEGSVIIISNAPEK